MSVDSVLDSAFTTLLAKARQRADEIAAVSPRPATLNFGWGGGGAALTAPTADPVLLEVPWPGEIRWAHMYAGDANGVFVAVTATISVQITRVTTFGLGGSLPLYGTAIPTLIAAPAADLVITTWVTNLLPGDALIAKLETFEGDATWISLNLLLYPTRDDLGSAELLSDGGDELTDSDGNIVVQRN